MDAPTRNRLDSFLLARFPHFRPAYEELTSWRKDPGGHLVYATLFTPYLTALLESQPARQTELTAAFAFVEELARTEAVGVREVLVDSVLAALAANPQWVQSSWPFMGATTRRLMQAIANASG